MRIKEYKTDTGRFALDLDEIAELRMDNDYTGIIILTKGGDCYSTGVPYDQLLNDWKGEE